MNFHIIYGNFLKSKSTIMATAPKKRKYAENYIDYRFTYIQNSGIQNPQCVVCNETLSAESMKPSKLKRHLETRHPEHLSKDPSFLKRMETVMKRSRLDTTGIYQQQLFACIEASYLVSLRIARKHKPHTIGEDLILPCAKDMIQLIFGMNLPKSYHLSHFLITPSSEEFLICRITY